MRVNRNIFKTTYSASGFTTYSVDLVSTGRWYCDVNTDWAGKTVGHMHTAHPSLTYETCRRYCD